jgi:hypothetical protein
MALAGSIFFMFDHSMVLPAGRATPGRKPEGCIKMKETLVSGLIAFLCALLLAGLFISIVGLLQAKDVPF